MTTIRLCTVISTLKSSLSGKPTPWLDSSFLLPHQKKHCCFTVYFFVSPSLFFSLPSCGFFTFLPLIFSHPKTAPREWIIPWTLTAAIPGTKMSVLFYFPSNTIPTTPPSQANAFDVERLSPLANHCLTSLPSSPSQLRESVFPPSATLKLWLPSRLKVPPRAAKAFDVFVSCRGKSRCRCCCCFSPMTTNQWGRSVGWGKGWENFRLNIPSFVGGKKNSFSKVARASKHWMVENRSAIVSDYR